MNNKIKCIENLLSPHINKNKNKEKDKYKKLEISFENWKFLFVNILSKTKNTLEKFKEELNTLIINNENLILNK